MTRPLDYDSKIVLIGSCFAENLTGKLDYYKFQNSSNPFGILFHPQAITNFFEAVEEKRVFTKEDLVYNQERWHSFLAHSALSDPEPEKVVDNLNKAVLATYEYFKSATHIFITLGTAWGYHHKKTGKIVANCHKLPQNRFEKELGGVSEITGSLQKILNIIDRFTDASVIFTVSPVRHLKDGFVENQRSKAHLIAAVHEVVAAPDKVTYFPSYEIMMDELRDYRFYDRDMLHPSIIAIDYIWERFAEVALSPQAKKYAGQIEEVQKMMAHRPFNPESKQHKKFLSALAHKKTTLLKELSHLHF